MAKAAVLTIMYSLRIKHDLKQFQKTTMKNLKIGFTSQWLSRYIARFTIYLGHGMLVITLIYLLPFDKKLQEHLLHPILSSSTGDNFMIL